jgi:hypothetical protein
MENPIINPIYSVRPLDNGSLLEKRTPEIYGPPAASGGIEYLPDALRLELPSFDRGELIRMRTANRVRFAHLARKFVVINVPARFK